MIQPTVPTSTPVRSAGQRVTRRRLSTVADNSTSSTGPARPTSAATGRRRRPLRRGRRLSRDARDPDDPRRTGRRAAGAGGQPEPTPSFAGEGSGSADFIIAIRRYKGRYRFPTSIRHRPPAQGRLEALSGDRKAVQHSLRINDQWRNLVRLGRRQHPPTGDSGLPLKWRPDDHRHETAPYIHPGEVLNEEFLLPMSITQYRLGEIHRGDAPVRVMAVASDGSLSVALDTALTEELRSEGRAREVVSRIQRARRDLATSGWRSPTGSGSGITATSSPVRCWRWRSSPDPCKAG